MSIYTKRGDKGETSLYDKNSSQKNRVSKDSSRIRAIGSIDELNSLLGVCVALESNIRGKKFLQKIQSDLFVIGAILAGADKRFSSSKVRYLERRIDSLEGKLPVLSHFILPGGGFLAANLHLARSVARRAERSIVALSKKERVKPPILVFINRTSDLLFMLAREANAKERTAETTWTSKVLK